MIHVRQALWHSEIIEPKTESSVRDVPVHPEIARMLSQFMGERKSGFLFCNREGRGILQTNILRRHLHPILKELGIEKQGCHGWRRFRTTVLRRMRIPLDVERAWLGHTAGVRDIGDQYSKLASDKAFTNQCLLDAGLGFELPAQSVPFFVPLDGQKNGDATIAS